jgi:hypothetical protein
MYKHNYLHEFVQVLFWRQEHPMSSRTYAVLIADIMESSSRRDLRALLGQKLAAVSKRHLRRKLIQLPYSVTAGDEFQTVTASLSALPAIILDLRSMLRPLSLRIGIGIGPIPGRIQPPVNRLSGGAFQTARSAIESIKSGSLFKFQVLTAFVTRNDSFNETINLLYGLHDTLVRKITDKQWEAIAVFREHPALEKASRRLHLDASTVSRNLKRGYFWQLSDTVTVAEGLIKRSFR